MAGFEDLAHRATAAHAKIRELIYRRPSFSMFEREVPPKPNTRSTQRYFAHREGLSMRRLCSSRRLGLSSISILSLLLGSIVLRKASKGFRSALLARSFKAPSVVSSPTIADAGGDTIAPGGCGAPFPNWRMAVADDGKTQIRTRRADDGTISIKLTDGAVSIVAALSPAAVAHLFAEQAEVA